METHIHIGKIIRKTLREQGRSVKWFAGQLPCDRTTVYKLFKKESIDTALLQRISEILNDNLFEYYCQNSKKVADFATKMQRHPPHKNNI